MIRLTDEQLQDFQEAVAWESALRLPDGRVLGVPGKRGGISEEGDFRVQALVERVGLEGKTVLELGCHEGNHTVQLAKHAGQVVAVEVRPKNIVCALVRLFVHDARNVRVVLADVRELDEWFGRFEVLFHVGVLYHLSDPVDHLYRAARLAETMLLDTHYETLDSSRERADLRRGDVPYVAFVRREGGWESTFSGVEETSRWLERESLLRLVGDAGFPHVEILDDRRERNGRRMTLLARKHRV